MNSRHNILNKLNKAQSKDALAIPAIIPDIQIFSDYPDQPNLLDIFTKRFESLHGELYIVQNLQEAINRLKNKILSTIYEKCVTFKSSIINELLENDSSLSNHFDTLDTENIDSSKFADYDASLTTADFLIARTGSIVLNSANHGGRRISVLPPVHIVIARKSQIIKSLDEIFTDEYISYNWSFATIISGPSRTSDIEKQLVLGAHGPKRLIVILIENQ